MSVLVFDNETHTLARHETSQAALAGREPGALKAQRWLFFSEDGLPLRVDILFEGGASLRPWASCSSCSLEQILPWVEASADGLDSVALEALSARLAGRRAGGA